MNTAPAFRIDHLHRLHAGPDTPPVEHGWLTPNHGGPLRAPRLIVLHYTAGDTTEGSVRWLCDAGAKASAHLVVGRYGKVYQLLGLATEAWHAGVSRWGKQTSLNHSSIGIEMANLGHLTPVQGRYQTPARVPIDAARILHAAHRGGGPVLAWERYPAPQVATIVALCAALQTRYPTITEIVGHDDIAPGRKTDPGPAWEWPAFRRALAAHTTPSEPHHV